MRIPATCSVVLVALVALVAACGSSSTGGSGGDVADVAADRGPGTDSVDAGTDVGAAEVPDTAPEAVDPCLGPAAPLGCGCSTGETCGSGKCVLGPDSGGVCGEKTGLACSAACTDACDAEWWQCVSGACYYMPALLGRPCALDADCNEVAGQGNVCFNVDGALGFCASPCVEDACPEGFTCNQAEDLCLPSDEDACGERFEGCTSPCMNKNEFGSCAGIAKCAGGKLVCNADLPEQEVCNGKDENCNDEVDEDASDCTVYLLDVDEDGYVDPEGEKCLCQPDAENGFDVKQGEELGEDCEDGDATVNPGAVEICDGIDNDCSGIADDNAEGCTEYLLDFDQDGYVVDGKVACLCAADPVSGYGTVPGTEKGLDCDDVKAVVHPGLIELCNGYDDNCDGVVDEYCSICKPGSCEACAEAEGCEVVEPGEEHTFEFGKGSDMPFDPGTHDSQAVGMTADGELTVDASTVELPFLWGANNGDDTVSKVDTKLGKEIGEYRVCDDPSRTAVDTDGSVWVACRSGSQVAIIAAHTAYCHDRNGDGIIQTSADADGDGRITGAEILDKGADECVLYVGSPLIPEENLTIWSKYNNGSCGNVGLRGLAISGEHEAWAGGLCSSTGCNCTDWGCCGQDSRNIWHLKYEYDPLQPYAAEANPRVVVTKTINTGMKYNYGFAIDQSGIIWVSSLDQKLLGRVDPATGETKTYPFNGTNYGIGVDYKGRVWMGSWGGADTAIAYMFDPATEAFSYITDRYDSTPESPKGWAQDTGLSAYNNSRGIMPSGKPEHPYVYVSLSEASYGVVKIDAESLKTVGVIRLDANGVCSSGNSGCGVTLDGEGQVWELSMNKCGSSEFDGQGHDFSVATEVKMDAVGIDVDADQDGTPDKPYFLSPASGNGADDEKAVVTAIADLGSGTYSYSDLSGYQLNTVVAPKGHYTQRFQGWGCCPGAATLEGACGVTTSWLTATTQHQPLPLGAKVRVAYRAADCVADLEKLPFSNAVEPTECAPDGTMCTFDLGSTAVGMFLDLRVILLPASSGQSPVLTKVTVHAVRNECLAFSTNFPSCKLLQQADPSCPSGPYFIDPDGWEGPGEPFGTECDMVTDGGGWTLIAFEDFEKPTAGWSAVNTITSCGSFGNILGGYGALSTGSNAKTYDLKGVAHQEAHLELDFVKIDSWDGETALVKFGDVELFKTTFCFCMAGCQDGDPPGLCDGANVCGGSWPQERVEHVSGTVPHNGPSILVYGETTLEQDPFDESWGFDNIQIKVR